MKKLIKPHDDSSEVKAISEALRNLGPRAGAAAILEAAAQTFRDHHVVYGDNYKLVGSVMAALFPAGLSFKTPHDWNRAHIFMLMVVKLTRYSNNWDKGGHQDSVRDLAVYAAMLESIDAMMTLDAAENH